MLITTIILLLDNLSFVLWQTKQKTISKRNHSKRKKKVNENDLENIHFLATVTWEKTEYWCLLRIRKVK